MGKEMMSSIPFSDYMKNLTVLDCKYEITVKRSPKSNQNQNKNYIDNNKHNDNQNKYINLKLSNELLTDISMTPAATTNTYTSLLEKKSSLIIDPDTGARAGIDGENAIDTSKNQSMMIEKKENSNNKNKQLRKQEFLINTLSQTSFKTLKKKEEQTQEEKILLSKVMNILSYNINDRLEKLKHASLYGNANMNIKIGSYNSNNILHTYANNNEIINHRKQKSMFDKQIKEINKYPNDRNTIEVIKTNNNEIFNTDFDISKRKNISTLGIKFPEKIKFSKGLNGKIM